MDEIAVELAGGHFHRQPWPGRIHGLAVWTKSPSHFPRPMALPLPASRLPGRLPRRRAQIVQVGEITFANVHLSHGQLLNRRQLARIAAFLQWQALGDHRRLQRRRSDPDAGLLRCRPTRTDTLRPATSMPFRLDRCLVHGLRLRRRQPRSTFGRSDHRPISARPGTSRQAAARRDPLRATRHRIARLRRGVALGRLLQIGLQQASSAIAQTRSAAGRGVDARQPSTGDGSRRARRGDLVARKPASCNSTLSSKLSRKLLRVPVRAADHRPAESSIGHQLRMFEGRRQQPDAAARLDQ